MQLLLFPSNISFVCLWKNILQVSLNCSLLDNGNEFIVKYIMFNMFFGHIFTRFVSNIHILAMKCMNKYYSWYYVMKSYEKCILTLLAASPMSSMKLTIVTLNIQTDFIRFYELEHKGVVIKIIQICILLHVYLSFNIHSFISWNKFSAYYIINILRLVIHIYWTKSCLV